MNYENQNEAIVAQQILAQEQSETISNLENKRESQANEIKALKSQMSEMIESVRSIQRKTDKCCNHTNEPATGSANGTYLNETELELEQNIPNPFSEQTRINYTLPSEAQIELTIK